MDVESTVKEFNLSRRAAGKLLNVSTRTLDRYVKEKKLSTRTVNGRVWLDKKELLEFKALRDAPSDSVDVDMSTSDLSTHVDIDNVDNDIDNVDRVEVFESRHVDSRQNFSKSRHEEGHEDTYEKLYLEIKDELKEKQERLEIANYRVGQLEAQVRNSVPMLEYHRENFEKTKKQQELKNQLEEGSRLIKNLSMQIRKERLIKRAFLIFLFTILALQPLWVLVLSN